MAETVKIGKVFAGRYLIESELPSTLPHASFWEVHDHALDRKLTMMTVADELAPDVLEAARKTSLLENPGVGRIIRAESTGETVYIILESAEGRTISEIVADGPIESRDARSIVGECARILDVARNKGVHHGGLRPEAVTIASNGRVRLMGVGIDGVLLGTAKKDQHEAAEQDAVDLVKLLYTLLTGTWPGDADRSNGLPVTTLIDGSVPSIIELIPSIDPQLNFLCMSTLGDVNEGPKSPGEVVAVLEPWEPLRSNEFSKASLVGGRRTGEALKGALAQADNAENPAQTVFPRGAGAAHAVATAESLAHDTTNEPPPPRPRAYLPEDAGPRTEMIAISQGARSGINDTSTWGMLPGEEPTNPTDDIFFPRNEELQEADLDSRKVLMGVIGAGLAAVVIVAVVAVIITSSSRTVIADEPPPATTSSEQPSSSMSPTQSQTPTETPTANAPLIPVTPVSAELLDPYGDGQEHPEWINRLIDGEPASQWMTRYYASQNYGIKSGVGVRLTLPSETLVTDVIIDTPCTGGTVNVMRDVPDASGTGEVLGTASFSPTGTTITLTSPTELSNFVLWFPTLPTDKEGRNRVRIAEVTVQ